MIFDIILESVSNILKHIKKYMRHIVSIFLSVAVIIIMQCIEHSAVAQVMTDIDSDIDGKTIRISVVNTENADDNNMSSDTIPEQFLIDYLDIKKLLEENHAKIIQCQIFDIGRIVSDVTEVKAEIMQCTSEYLKKYESTYLNGRMINDTDMNTVNPSAVISNRAASMLWGETDILGKNIEIYTDEHGVIDVNIVGRLYDDNQMKDDEDDEYTASVYVNSQFIQSIESKQNTLINELEFVLDNEYNEKELIGLLHQEYDGKYYGTSWKMKVEYESLETEDIDGIIRIINYVIEFFAVLAFLVSNLGLMNMRLISVAERFKEIGVRKAIGAENKHISIQIITESVTLSIIGAIIGVAIGFLVGTLITLILYKIYSDSIERFVLFMPFKSTIISIIVTFMVSIIFSLFPAYKASKLVVIDAIRNQD